MAERDTARQRGTAALVRLYELAGSPRYNQVKDRGDLAGSSISTSTMTNLLTGRGAPRPRTIAAFISACLYYAQRRKPSVLQPGQDQVEYWQGLYDEALGRAPTPAVSLVRVGSVPEPANAFVDRSITQSVERAVDDGQTAVLTQVLSGLGGVGKTQLAAQYTRQQWPDPATEVIVWVSATSRDAILTTYATAAARILGAEESQPEQAAQGLLSWLSTTTQRWLIVLDDLQVPGDLAGLWPPSTSTGQVVITTRYRGDALDRPDSQLIQVGVFTFDEASAYLHARLTKHPELAGDDADVTGLAKDLGHLPLALAQAAAYMINARLPVRKYQQLVVDQRRTLAELVPDRDELPDQHRDTVAATWSLSIQKANTLAPVGLARPLLEIASLLDPTGIPDTIFTTDAITTYLSGLLNQPVDTHAIRAGVRILHRFNILTIDPATPHRGVQVHGLVQRATRDTLTRDTDPEDAIADITGTDGRLGDLVLTAADALLEIWPAIEADNDLALALRTNAEILATHATHHLWDPDGHPILFRIGRSLGEAGLVTHAASYFHTLHTAATGYLGHDHPDTVTTRANLAEWRGETGDATQAAAEFEWLLTNQLRELGPNHLDTLATRGNLAYWRGETGDAVGALTEFEQLLGDHLRVLGPDHLHTLTTRLNLARGRGRTGDAVGAVAQLERLLTDYLRVLGPDHPDTLGIRDNLARWRGEAGQAASAVIEFEQLLGDYLRVLSPDHPDTLRCRHNLAYWRAEATGDAETAVTEFEQLLGDRLRVLGPDHPDTLTTRHNLARWRGHAGDAARAVTEFEQLLTDWLRVRGPNHPHTLATRRNLVYWTAEAEGKHRSSSDAG